MRGTVSLFTRRYLRFGISSPEGSPSTHIHTTLGQNTKLLTRLHQQGQQGWPARYVVDNDVLMQRMGSIPLHSEAVESRDAQCSGERSVAPSPRGAFPQVHSYRSRQSSRFLVKRNHSWCSLQ